jgi:hypothetical protein
MSIKSEHRVLEEALMLARTVVIWHPSLWPRSLRAAELCELGTQLLTGVVDPVLAAQQASQPILVAASRNRHGATPPLGRELYAEMTEAADVTPTSPAGHRTNCHIFAMGPNS